MDYSFHYTRLIERARTRIIDGYSEKHHVVPRCMNGDDSHDNIVTLTPEEHYVAHQLLVKMYPNHLGLISALVLMSGHKNGLRNNNRIYGWIRRKLAVAMSIRVISDETRQKMSSRIITEAHRRNIGKSKIGKQYSLGIKRSDETKAKISAAKKGVSTSLKGKPKSDEHKQKLRKPKSEEHKQKMREIYSDPTRKEFISKLHKGKVVSETQKMKQSLAMKGRPSPRKGIPMSEEAKAKLSKTQKERLTRKNTK